jgi:hypothetical protein
MSSLRLKRILLSNSRNYWRNRDRDLVISPSEMTAILSSNSLRLTVQGWVFGGKE